MIIFFTTPFVLFKNNVCLLTQQVVDHLVSLPLLSYFSFDYFLVGFLFIGSLVVLFNVIILIVDVLKGVDTTEHHEKLPVVNVVTFYDKISKRRHRNLRQVVIAGHLLFRAI